MQNTNRLTNSEFKEIVTSAILKYKDFSQNISFLSNNLDCFKEKYPYAYIYLSNMYKRSSEGIFKKYDEYLVSKDRRFFYEKLAEMLPDGENRFTYFSANVNHREFDRIVVNGQREQKGIDFSAFIFTLFCQYAYEGVKIEEYMSGLSKDSFASYSLEKDMLQLVNGKLRFLLRRYSEDKITCQFNLGKSVNVYLESNPEYTDVDFNSLIVRSRKPRI